MSTMDVFDRKQAVRDAAMAWVEMAHRNNARLWDDNRRGEQLEDEHVVQVAFYEVVDQMIGVQA